MKIQLSDHFTYRKLLRFTMPSIIMMIFISIYGVVDGLFVSNYAGKAPFTAINIIMPYIMIFGSFGFMIGTGGTALISKTLGMGDKEKANEIFSMLTAVCVISGLALTAISMLLLRPVAILLGAEGEILEHCVTYGVIVLPATTAYILQFSFQSFCVTAEKSNLSLIMTVASGICNIVLDFLFIAILGWGLPGAASATAISQILGAVIPLFYFSRKNPSLLQLRKFRFDGKALLRTVTNGSSELMSNLSMNIVGMLYNLQLIRYAGEDGVAAYGVIMYVNLVFMAIFIGFSIGTAPLFGYNHGADNEQELKNLFRKSMTILAVTSVAMAAAAMALASPLAQIFVGYDKVLMAMTARGFVIYAFSFLFSGFNMFGSSMFTAFNNGLISAVISFVRTLVCQIAAVLLLPLIFHLDGIWMSIVAAELAAVLLTAFCFVKFRKRYHYA
ncbi:MAG: MATE family efflux transporter [Oscillospiraceae bacterium]|nr:MATE family efflux transporter [Oscillospiraceae bacterium]